MSVHDNFDLTGFLKSKKLLKENQESKEATKWSNLEDEMKWELLLTAVKDPKEAEHYIELKWDDLPPEVQSNIDWSKESEGQELDEVSDESNLDDPRKYTKADILYILKENGYENDPIYDLFEEEL